MIRKVFDTKNKFISLFNTETGVYMRTGILDDNGKDTGIDPFMATMPQLLDIGIMGSCPNGRLGICAKSGVQCYQNGLNQSEPNMTLEDYESIMKQCRDKTFQIALGGRGDANLHENFKEILECTRKYNMVPNYTTSGINLTDEQIKLTKELCGSVAVSWYRNDITLNSINRFIQAGIKTNIHYVLGNNTIDEAITRLKNNDFPKGINAIIFLLHKPVGQGQQRNVLHVEDPKVKEFFEIIDNCMGKVDFKIGFDSCSVGGILSFSQNIDPISIDACEGALFSAYISSDMKMIPCSFDNQDLKWAVDLRKYTLEEAWNSEQFNNFRNIHKTGCKSQCNNCNLKTVSCRPCPIVPQINLCNKS